MVIAVLPPPFDSAQGAAEWLRAFTSRIGP
jgi:hypothetical protein